VPRKMSAISLLNPKAQVNSSAQALSFNISAAKGLQDVLKTNLGPKGTMKMLVSGSGDIKITKDGNVLLHEMQIQHPTASMVARTATAQDDTTGDGTTSTVLLIGELLRQAELYLVDGLHPRLIAEGFEKAKDIALDELTKFALSAGQGDREKLIQVARTALRTKIHQQTADLLTEICVDAVDSIRKPGVKEIDLHMVEIMTMQHRQDLDSVLVKGLVLDHGARHPEMKKRAKNCYILTCNVSLEYEKTEVNSSFFYKSAEEREKLAKSEHEFINLRVQKIVELKKEMLAKDPDATLVVINQNGIDPESLDKLAKEGIVALRRAKRRNMERLTLACGGIAVNTVDNLTLDVLGRAGHVYEHIIGEDKYTFVEECHNPASVTILIKAPNKYTITQVKDAVRDGLRAVKNVHDDDKVVPGAGSFELAAANKIRQELPNVKGKVRLGMQAFADALMIIPKVLGQNAGYDPQETVVKLLQEVDAGVPCGIDLASGEAVNPVDSGIFDNYNVKEQIINSCAIVASNLLLVDEVMKAGLSSLKG